MVRLESLLLKFEVYGSILSDLLRKKPQPKIHHHEQAYLKGFDITCDQKIAHVIEALNRIEGVETVLSCQYDPYLGIGFVQIREQNGRFLSYLESELNQDPNYWPNRWSLDGVPNMFLRMTDQFLYGGIDNNKMEYWWNKVFELTSTYGSNN